MLILALPYNAKRIAVALSGGPDSWALVLLAKDWCTQNGATLTAITVDHKLRDSSSAEAAAIAAECAKRGIKHETLTWNHGPITSALQQQARDARYDLLTAYCRDHQIPLLLTAHHADDQSETVLLRFAKASDVGGLAGLQPLHNLHGIAVARPLLDYTKQQLIDYAIAAGVSFIQDPSNENPRFARARLRDARNVLEAEGLTTANLVRLADKMRAADDALQYAADQFIISQFVAAPYGISAPKAAMLNKPAALVQRGLLAMWRHATGDAGHPIGHDQLQRLLAFVQQDAEHKITTGGMVLEQASGTLYAARELAACAAPVTIAPKSSAVWDSRFTITNSTAAPITVGALGDYGRDRIEKLGAAYTWLHDATNAARRSLPARLDGAEPVPLIISSAAENTVTAAVLPVKSTDITLYSAGLNLSIV